MVRLGLCTLWFIAGGVLGGVGAEFWLSPEYNAPTPGVERSVDESYSSQYFNETDQFTSVAMDRKFVVPIIQGQETVALIGINLAVEVRAEAEAYVRSMEPRLRDVFVSELFSMSYTGAFDGDYTDVGIIDELRENLLTSARSVMGETVRAVLVLDLIRQER